MDFTLRDGRVEDVCPLPASSQRTIARNATQGRYTCNRLDPLFTELFCKLQDPETNGKVVKVSPEKVLCIGEVERGRIISVPDVTVFFLEEGNSRNGYQHIIARHRTDFANRGIPESQIIDFINQRISQDSAKYTLPGQSGGLGSVYEFDGKEYNIVVSDNGYIVSSYPLPS
ncbi:MAG: hypothetical protein HC921_21910 [Synechococcaceae cyanobacterium SM2_3_1]|nr:hypothetical protein [Synechococcaceae cyanobacterium SM2_3_1]